LRGLEIGSRAAKKIACFEIHSNSTLTAFFN